MAVGNGELLSSIFLLLFLFIACHSFAVAISLHRPTFTWAWLFTLPLDFCMGFGYLLIYLLSYGLRSSPPLPSFCMGLALLSASPLVYGKEAKISTSSPCYFFYTLVCNLFIFKMKKVDVVTGAFIRLVWASGGRAEGFGFRGGERWEECVGSGAVRYGSSREGVGDWKGQGWIIGLVKERDCGLLGCLAVGWNGAPEGERAM